jgi:hypothetical protein
MGRFTVFVTGCAEGLPVEFDAVSISDIEALISGRRFIPGELVDVPNSDGIYCTRAALIPVSRIQMIMEDE